jgi:single-strand selective monofunctional uracil DNA glycosylase
VPDTADILIKSAKRLARELDQLRFPAPVAYVYNPLNYAWACHAEYLRRFAGQPRRVLFLGMNPGPFGMAQTGVPFGEVAAVRDWLGIHEKVGRPKVEHPAKPVSGFDCPRSEVSGRRLWGLFASRFGTAQKFFAAHFVYNYCPLMFLDGGKGGKNLTPDKFTGPASRRMTELCDEHLRLLVDALGCEWAIGVGGFAEQRLIEAMGTRPVRIGRILHPSPASPAANRDWAGAATRELERLGVWSCA